MSALVSLSEVDGPREPIAGWPVIGLRAAGAAAKTIIPVTSPSLFQAMMPMTDSLGVVSRGLQGSGLPDRSTQGPDRP